MLSIALQSVLYFPQGSLPASSRYCVFYIHPSPRNHPRLTAWKVNVWAEGSKEIVRCFFIALEKCQILCTFCYIEFETFQNEYLCTKKCTCYLK